MYVLQQMATAELGDHVAMIRFYFDDQIEITGELLTVSQQLVKQGDNYVRSFPAIKRAVSGDELVVKVAWQRAGKGVEHK